MAKPLNSKELKVKPLSKEAFAPFGDLIEASDSANHFAINEGFTERYHDLATVEASGQNGRGAISIFRSTPLAQPIKIKMMERHPLGSQAFMPLNQRPYLVVVATKGEFDPANIAVFLAQANQGVNYHAGTWHHFCLALEQVSDFLVVDRVGDGDNCDVVQLDGNLMIEKAIC